MKAITFTDFYRAMDYDAIGLSSRETAFGLEMWRTVAESGAPILAANVFLPNTGKRPFFSRLFGGKPKDRPIFRQCVIREDHGQKLAVIGFLSPSAWAAMKDTSVAYIYKSPFEMDRLIQQSAKTCDHLTVVGEFNQQEADSLARTFPVIDMIVSSALRSDQPSTVGRTVLVGTIARGNNANFIDLLPMSSDTAASFADVRQMLDGSIPEDTTIVNLLAGAKKREAGVLQNR
ncbi:hypothetical protein KKH27_13945 [bacterium]|nr:hypothetical protein [bacterium]MBU1983980.1 hypothetical protein [bacterium]